MTDPAAPSDGSAAPPTVVRRRTHPLSPLIAAVRTVGVLIGAMVVFGNEGVRDAASATGGLLGLLILLGSAAVLLLQGLHPAQQTVLAIGQKLKAGDLGEGSVALDGGRIAVDAEGRTSNPKVWAGGDCTGTGLDLTVEAVAAGRDAARSIDSALRATA